MLNNQLVAVNDPGHGWLKVPMWELKALGIMDKITPYSFISDAGKLAYLEEDCDATTYLKARKEQGHPDPVIVDQYVNYFNRNKKSFPRQAQPDPVAAINSQLFG
jgi:hypothetical protein